MNVETEIKLVITHDNCADGLMSALVCKRVFPGAEIVFCQYGTEKYRLLVPQPGALFVDFSPSRDTAQAWADVGAYVLDHHEHAKDIVALFGDRGLFDNSRCGARLAMEELGAGIADERLRRAVLLADIRDRWVKDSPDWDAAQAQHRAMMAVHRDVWLESGNVPDAAMLAFGEMMAATERQNAERIVGTLRPVANCFDLKVGTCVCSAAMSSMVGDVAREQGYDLTACIAFVRDDATGKESWVFSLRSSERFDCGAFAKKNGGGGHARAAGFSVPCQMDDRYGYENPNPVLYRALQGHPRIRANMDCIQDGCENAHFASVGGLTKRSAMVAPRYIAEDEASEYLDGYRASAKHQYGDDWETCEFCWSPVLTLGGAE